MDSGVIKKLERFFSSYPLQEFKKGDIIMQADVEPKGVYFIVKGIVRNYWISEDGNEVTLNMYKPHSFLPMSWAIADVKNTHFYEAMTNTTLRLAPRKDTISFLQKEPDILYDLLRRIYIGMEGLWGHIESLTSGNSYNKLAASLVVLAKRFGKNEKDMTIIQLKMNERDIANYAGMSRETASRELQKLKKDNLVSYEKGVLMLHNIHKLEETLLH